MKKVVGFGSVIWIYYINTALIFNREIMCNLKIISPELNWKNGITLTSGPPRMLILTGNIGPPFKPAEKGACLYIICFNVIANVKHQNQAPLFPTMRMELPTHRTVWDKHKLEPLGLREYTPQPFRSVPSPLKRFNTIDLTVGPGSRSDKSEYLISAHNQRVEDAHFGEQREGNFLICSWLYAPNARCCR